MIKQYKIEQWIVCSETNRIYSNDFEVNIEPQAMAVLIVLIENKGKVVNREQIIEKAWKGAIVSDSSLNRIIAQLRKAFSDNVKAPKYIETIAKKGYRFLGTPSSVKQVTKLSGYLLTTTLVLSAILITTFYVKKLNIYHTKLFLSERLTSEKGVEYEGSFSRDGNYMAYLTQKPKKGKKSLHLKSMKTGNTWVLHSSQNQDFFSPTFTPFSRSITFIHLKDGKCSIDQIQLSEFTAGRYSIQPIAKCDFNFPPTTIQWGRHTEELFIAERVAIESPIQINRLNPKTNKRIQLTFPKHGSWGDRVFDYNLESQQLAFIRWSPSKQQVYILNGLDNSLKEIPIKKWGIKSISWFSSIDSLLLTWRDELKVWNVFSNENDSILKGNDFDKSTILPMVNAIAVTRKKRMSDVWQFDVSSKTHLRLIESDAIESSAIFLDGFGKIAFVSDRTGKQQVWLSDENGMNQTQLSHFEENFTISSLAWSKKNRQLLFWESTNHNIWTMNLISGITSILYDSKFSLTYPQFSTSEKRITFGSMRSGDWEIWSMSIQGSDLLRLTFSGGYYGKLDDKQQKLYFTKYYDKGLWRKSLLIGATKLLLEEKATQSYSWWCLSNGYIYTVRNVMEKPGVYRYTKDGVLDSHIDSRTAMEGTIFNLNSNGSKWLYTLGDQTQGNIWKYELK